MEALSIVIAWRRPGKPLPCPGDRRRPPSRRRRGRTGPRDVDRALRHHRRRVDEGGRGGAPARGGRGGAGRRGLRGARPMSRPPIPDGALFRRRGRLLLAAPPVFVTLPVLMAPAVRPPPSTPLFLPRLLFPPFRVPTSPFSR